MQVVEVKIGDNWYKAEQEVIDALQACNKTSADLNKKLEGLYMAINEVIVKEHTAGIRPTRDMRMLAWRARQDLYRMVPWREVRQKELFEQ